MATNYSPMFTRDNLSLLYDPANIKCYPGSGTTMYDISGNANHGTLSGAPVFSGGTMTYDGVDDHITVPYNQTSLDFSQEQTVIIWMYHTFTSGRRNPYDQAYGGYGTWTHESGANINYYYGTAGSNTTPYTNRNSGTTPTGTWQMMATTRSLSTVSWYRNSVLVDTSPNVYGTTGTTNIDIRFGLGYAGRWIGEMGPMMLFKRSLPQTDLAKIFEAYRGRYGI